MKAVFEFPAKILEITEKNESFDACVVQIMYPGWNRKGMYFDKSVIERAIPTMFYCPIVTNYDIAEDSFGGHDVTIVKRDDGVVRMVNLTDGIGVVPNDAEWFWQTVTEEDGTEREYLCVNAILWKRSAAYEKIKRDGFAAHSMEINIHAYHKTDDGIVVDDFSFEAFTVIGVEPCFESSSVHFSLEADHGSNLNAMLEDYKKAFSLVNPEEVPTSVDNINPAKGGNEQLDIAKLLAEFSLTEEDINFEIGEMSEDEVRAKFTEIAAAKEQPAPADDPKPEQSFSLTASEVEAQIMNAMSAVMMYDEYWREQTCRYWYQDRDDEACEVYMYDRQNKYVVGVPYSLSGDNVVLNFEAAKRKKIQYVDFEEGAADTVYPFFSAMQENVETHVAALNQKIADLEKFKADTEAARAEDEAQSVFSMFPDLTGNAEFEALVASHSGMDRDALEKECYAIRGKTIVPAKFSLNDKQPNRVPVEPEHNNKKDEPYGGVFKKYLSI